MRKLAATYNVSTYTIRKVIKSNSPNDPIFPYKQLIVPRLSPIQINKRLLFSIMLFIICLNKNKYKYCRLNYCGYWKNVMNIQQITFKMKNHLNWDVYQIDKIHNFYARRSNKNVIPPVMVENTL